MTIPQLKKHNKTVALQDDWIASESSRLARGVCKHEDILEVAKRHTERSLLNPDILGLLRREVLNVRIMTPPKVSPQVLASLVRSIITTSAFSSILFAILRPYLIVQQWDGRSFTTSRLEFSTLIYCGLLLGAAIIVQVFADWLRIRSQRSDCLDSNTAQIALFFERTQFHFSTLTKHQ
jgi:hypothetical protein